MSDPVRATAAARGRQTSAIDARAGATIEAIRQLFDRLGERAYAGEPVTQLEHALQSAALAQAAGASEALVAAALLHDIGHLVNDEGETPTERGVDDLHQFHGAKFLRETFGRAVSEPVRLHVEAKRYLCATRPGYYDSLSADSKRSLALQGGVHDDDGAAAFAGNEFAQDATRLRLWDDQAKVAGMVTPTLDDLLPLLARVAHAARAA
jgi:phosphonate degradation associated HDIG domain protein